MRRKGLKIGFCHDQHVLIKIYNWIFFVKLCFCILYMWIVGYVLSAVCFSRAPQTIEISGSAGSRHRSLLLFPYAIFRQQRIRSCRHANQWVWSVLPAVNPLHSNDEWICQWEGCSKFEVLNPAAINTLCAIGGGAKHTSASAFGVCWRVSLQLLI
jgi:hypothetical protein